jgi:hypothetical protein
METEAIVELIRCASDNNVSQKHVIKQLAKMAGKSYYPILASLVNTTNENKFKINNYDKVK